MPDRGFPVRTFEVARTYRFAKGSGMSIPVIEIGAGGGSIAWVDAMGRIQTGPESASFEPDNFVGGAIKLSVNSAEAAINRGFGDKLNLAAEPAIFGICEVVD